MMLAATLTAVIPGWSEGPDPESETPRELRTGFDALHRPGMTERKSA